MFTQIAGTEEQWHALGTFPAINDQGTAIFWAEWQPENSDRTDSGLLIGNGETVTTIVDSGTSPFSLFSNTPVINNQNTAVFSANVDTIGSGIFSISHGVTQTIASDPNPRGVFGEPALNNGGTIAFPVYQYTSNDASSAILLYRNDATTPIVDSEGAFRFFEEVDINDADHVAFSAVLDNGDRGIFLEKGEEIIPIVETSESFSFVANPSVNNADTVLFKGVSKDAAIEGLYAVNGGVTETLVDSQGEFASFDRPSINDTGVFAFKGFLDNGRFGLFTGADPIADKVIAVGDPLAGSTVTDLFLSTNGLNNQNQIVFFAQLDNGTSGIFRADLGSSSLTESLYSAI